MTDAPADTLQPEFGPAMRALAPRWQKAVVALFLTKGNRSAALRAAGYKANKNAIGVLASRMFADDRMRAAVREVALAQIDIAEPELLGVTLSIMRDTKELARDRLTAARMVWDRANPVISKHKLEVEHHLTNDERDITHYRALQKLRAPQEAFLARFGHTGMARVQALVMAEDARTKQIAAAAGAVIDGEFEEVTVDAAE
jgi:hypothetical protein